MKKLNIGLVGAGGIARGIHLPSLTAIPEARIAAVCDLIAERAQEAAGTFGIPKTYRSYHDMLREGGLDAVYVLVPPDGLFRVASDALLAGKHVFMEKPMGISCFQAKTLKELAALQERVLHVGFNRRFIPLVTVMAAKMREFCPITHVEGRFYKNGSPAFYGGCASAFVCDVIHVIDLVRHLAAGDSGVSPRALRASTLESVNPETHIPEAWYSALAFDNGVTAVVRANYRTGGRVHQFELHGPGTSAYIDLGFGGPFCCGKILHTVTPGGQSLSAAGAGEQEILEFDGLALAGSDKYEVYYGYHAENRHFVETVLANPAGTDPARTEEDCASMELVEQLLAARIA
ncbi:MAG: Gfo/Idh/MocA family oxidoreductase [Treponema sp.]|jgi:predicted dehydrogenase|nr:Gfo/Idh/MocA family oxidoreductase [Treponema sp.]